MSIALYLSAVYLFNPSESIRVTLQDYKLHLDVIALALFIASGFIINAFYDLEKDMINRPKLTFFDRHISRSFSFNCYFVFNLVAGVLSLFVHWQVFAINLLFSIVLWVYSHKLRKVKFLGEIGAAMLSVAPFFSLAIYYQKVTTKMFEFVALIFVFIIGREIVKKLIGIKGDIIIGDKSIPIIIGEERASRFVIFLAVLSIGQIVFFIRFLLKGQIDFVFYAMALILSAIIYFEAVAKNHEMVNRLYKILIIMCILSIPFI
ncbi:MAG: UbiA family prenyltransferase [Flavobacteriales bacterium]|nr:UbiA family prenyltransferase [Flavobacteriales bacterium]NNK80026.1 UbiA family prenyltransferase [Flavobacteriales bacterium]